MHRYEDLSGQKYGLWTVVKRVELNDGHSHYLCRCDCGTERIVAAANLKRGVSKCCGAKNHSPFKTHGKSNTKLYRVWVAMRSRCYDPKTKNYKNYGARGILVCPEWLGESGFQAFWDWAYANGYHENTDKRECTLDRIDVNGNYEPSNCRWITSLEQCYNKRNSIYLTHNGETKPLKDWCVIYNVRYNTAHGRYMRLKKKNEEITFDKIVH